MNAQILEFAKKANPTGRVIDVGSYDVNGTFRSVVPVTIGVDMREGPAVDRVCNAEDLLATFGPESFDWVLSAEMLEHVRHWEPTLVNLWGILKPEGKLLLTMASPRKGYHGYPHDYWRWPMERFIKIFAGNKIIASFDQGSSQGVVVIKTEPLDLTITPDKVVNPKGPKPK